MRESGVLRPKLRVEIKCEGVIATNLSADTTSRAPFRKATFPLSRERFPSNTEYATQQQTVIVECKDCKSGNDVCGSKGKTVVMYFCCAFACTRFLFVFLIYIGFYFLRFIVFCTSRSLHASLQWPLGSISDRIQRRQRWIHT